MGNLVEFLVHHGDTMLHGMLGIGEIEGLAFKEKLVGILPVDSKQAFHKGGLARAVFSHEGMDGTSRYFQVHVLEDLDAGEGFANAIHAQQVVFHRAYPLFDIKYRGRA